MNKIIDELYGVCKYSDKEHYTLYKNIACESFSWRMYTLYWQSKYFVRLLIWKGVDNKTFD
ncbi:hypothetical protein VP14_193 [Vibrio phage VPMCC14]|nr:hypothetical protein VP14_193 [Vibrio phage VPMCC14]